MNQVEKYESSQIENKREEFKKEGTISKEKERKYSFERTIEKKGKKNS